MDFTFSEEQRAATEAAQGVFAGVAPDAVPSPALTRGAVADGCDRPLWQRLAAADLLSLPLDEEYGGAGLDTIALCLVLRESAKVLARVPLLENTAAAMTVQTHGSPELKTELLARAGRGEIVLTVAAHGRTGHDAAELAVTARRDERGGTWILDGVQTAVPWAYDADFALVPARAEARAPARTEVGETGGRTVLALVPLPADGVVLAEQLSTTGERLAELRLESVRVDGRYVLDAAGAWERLYEVLVTGTCALALGLGEAVLDMTSRYTSRREQFGFPLATFQAVAVQAADRYVDLRAMAATLWQAAWRLSTEAPGMAGTASGTSRGALPTAGDVAVAKIWAAEGVRRVVQTAQHLHGGFGADVDYPLHRYHAWAKHLELSLGPASAHEEALGDLLAAHPLG
ncbi:acyl-CoA dehydrogenase domain-containing protein [Actinobacteria bacterium OK074]|nr:acyl-CoA dehydrogenase domain-containing protein [Actinobacteria bacterium OK074]